MGYKEDNLVEIESPMRKMKKNLELKILKKSMIPEEADDNTDEKLIKEDLLKKLKINF